MILSPGHRLGPYEIVGPLAAGGMGEVYRARDTRLDRRVAIKILPPELASDADRLRRFEHEARAASSLNHPNILTIHDVGTTDSISYIAMELVEGKTLGELIARGPFGIKELLGVALQLADGLAAAHEAGILHRDLKPSNVMVTREGLVKLLDFGLAKPARPRRRGPTDSLAVTEPETPTLPGTILGTVGYMSPEQARGENMDFRSDQFSFGSILYEMATGRRAFSGKTDLDVLAAIVRDEPDPIGKVRPDFPAAVSWTIDRCLSKEPSGRFAATRDLARDLLVLRDHVSDLTTGVVRVRKRRRFAPRIAGAVILVAALAALFLLRGRSERRPAEASIRFSLEPPESTVFNFTSSSPAPPALSPDGKWLAFGAKDSQGSNHLWLRALRDLSVRPLPGTEGATFPFWSADSRFIGFFADGKVRKIDPLGGSPETICDAADGRGGTWSREGVILFAPDRNGPILKVPAAGGTPTPVTRLDAGKPGTVHRWPSFLPDGQHFLFFVRRPGERGPQQEIRLGSLGSEESRPILTSASNALYASPGYLFFIREGSLFSIRFDPARLQTSGTATPVVQQVQFQPYRWYGVFSVSESGLLLYQGGPVVENSELVWYDRSGGRLQAAFAPGTYAGLRLSPDGQRCAMEVRDDQTGRIDIWLGDLTRAVTSRLTSSQGISDSPVWSPDGKRIAFASNRTGVWKIYEVPARESGEPKILLDTPDDKTPTDWSPDGAILAFNSSGPGTNFVWDIRALTLSDHSVRSLIRSAFGDVSGRFSPDGRWLAFSSNETGREEVYVQELAQGSRRWRVSPGGGTQPVWRRDGRELYYLAGGDTLMAVAWEPRSSEVARATVLFKAGIPSSGSDIPLFDVSPDGQRFLVNTTLQHQASPPLTLVVNWRAESKL